MDELGYLVENERYLLPTDKERLRVLLKQQARGFRSNKWIDHISPKVHPKQAQFLGLTTIEALYGGSAGGGKSWSLLLAALQYVDQPGYSAIIFRKTFTDLAGQGAIMDVAQRCLAGTEAKWSSMDKSFFFPTDGQPSRLSFGYLDSDNDRYRYQGLEFQFCGFDELTQHPEENYTYLFSRLRRLEGCHVPLRMRAATNPGGKYGDWVKERFIPEEYLASDEEVQFTNQWAKTEPCNECGATGKIEFDGELETCFYCDGTGQSSRDFIPSRLKDNPSLDRKTYLKSLAELGPVERYRLEHGRWDVSELGGIFRGSWLRYYSKRGDHFICHHIDGDSIRDQVLPNTTIRYFLTVDSASKEKTSADWTVIALWAYDTVYCNLFLVGALREKMDVPKLAPAVLTMVAAAGHPIEFVVIEDASSGIGLIQQLRLTCKGLTVRAFSPGSKDLVGNSIIAQIRMEAGQIFIPSGNPGWLAAFVAEWLAFPAGAHDDCVSVLNQAAYAVGHMHDQRKISTGRPTMIGAGLSGMRGRF